MKKILAILMVSLLIAAFAWAADDLFRKIDQDSDGKISKQEYLDAVAGKFAKRDTSNDGILSREEILTVDKIDAEKFIKKIDRDKDGTVVKKEFMDTAAKQFHTLDKNADGYIDAKEWRAARVAPKSPMFILFNF